MKWTVSIVLALCLTCDLMDVGFWNEVAWIQMGRRELSAGRHTLQIRPEPNFKEEQGKKIPEKILYCSDALCLTKSHFRPHGKLPTEGLGQGTTEPPLDPHLVARKRDHFHQLPQPRPAREGRAGDRPRRAGGDGLGSHAAGDGRWR